ncbi:mitochondrial potassium channel [Alosa sapidissima]|uniref:mitochondrial potassium channel n=1 Tax=Alosa sapidissima TaxID=34773 RepID=UPI001C0A0232|nr:mitochondrial potassium channel [Alosa sapidissima]XP_041945469.1 mitochondrial potassium channel [Alosa sapidissima]
MRYRLSGIPRTFGTYVSLHNGSSRLRQEMFISRAYCLHQKPQDGPSKMESVGQRTLATLKSLTELGMQWGQNSKQTATATVNYWWERYEEFVGLNEVRDAQLKVTEAEQAFMVARGMVREAHISLEANQVRLKEVRDRLDRVSREEVHYLELATLEHKLLQEERRLRTSYENAEGSEREKFALFSAGVRASHEKERARAERTKNWSVIGSILGAVIGVMGSTYINRVRLQELKSLLEEAQKGPASLQEVIKDQASMHKSLEDELQSLIGRLKTMLTDLSEKASAPQPTPVRAPPPPQPKPQPQPQPLPLASRAEPSASEAALKELLFCSQNSQALLEGVKAQLGQMSQSVGSVAAELQEVRKTLEMPPPPPVVVERPVIQTQEQMLVCDTESVMQGLDQAQRRLEIQINRATLYNTVLTYTAFALTVPALYFIFRST